MQHTRVPAPSIYITCLMLVGGPWKVVGSLCTACSAHAGPSSKDKLDFYTCSLAISWLLDATAASSMHTRIVGHDSLQAVKANTNLVQSEAGRWLCLSDPTLSLACCQLAELVLQPLLVCWQACLDPKACCVPVAAWLQRQGAWRRRGVAVGVSWAGLGAAPDDAVGAQCQGVRQGVPSAPGPCWLLKLLHHRRTVSLMQSFRKIAKTAGPIFYISACRSGRMTGLNIVCYSIHHWAYGMLPASSYRIL